jgi:hypothetical protein
MRTALALFSSGSLEIAAAQILQSAVPEFKKTGAFWIP